MSVEQVKKAEQLLEASRQGSESDSASSVDRLMRELAEQCFDVTQTLSPERIRQLVKAGKQTVLDFDGSAEDLVDWFQGQLDPTVAAEAAAEETLPLPGSEPPEPGVDESPSAEPPQVGEFKDQQTLVAPLGPAAKGPGDTADDAEMTLPVGAAEGRPAAGEDATLMGEAAAVPAAPSRNVVEPAVREFGDYVLLEEIARGGMGVVYKARQRKLNRIVALKMILSGQFAHESEVERFYIEAEAAANLSHDNIVTIYEVGEQDGQHFFSMDYIEGTSLGDAVTDGPLMPEEAAGLMVSISDAIQFAHEQGILHRDLKPSNVLLDTHNKPLLTDFGLAKQVGEGLDLTMSGAVVGTPSYMPPEQAAAKAEEVGVCSDVYSLGAILYELITGQPPFRAATTFDTLKQVLSVEPMPPRELNSAVPVDLETICLKCLQKEPAKRYASAQELVEELQRFLDGMPILARPVGRIERVARWCKRNKVVASLSGLAVSAVLVTMVYIVYSNIQIAAALKDSDESFKDAKKAVDDFFTSVAEDEIWARYPATRGFQQQLLARGLSFYEGFIERRGESALLDFDIAKARKNIAFAHLRQGDIEQALTHYRRSIVTLEELLGQQPDDPELLLSLTNSLTGFAQAQSSSEDLDLRVSAIDGFERAREIRLKLSERGGQDPEVLRKLANAYMNEGSARKGVAGLSEEGRKRVRTKVFELLDGAQVIRRRALKSIEAEANSGAQGSSRSAEKIRLLRDLGKGSTNLYALFFAEFGDLKDDADRMLAWTNTAGYLDEVLTEIGGIDQSLMTMQDRELMINAVQNKITWLIYYPEDLLPGDITAAIGEQINTVLPLADRLSFDVETPDFQRTAISFYLEVAQFAFDAGDDVLVIDAFRRLGAGWTSFSGEDRQIQLNLIETDIGGLISDYFIFADNLIELDKELADGQQMARIGGQLLSLAKENDWLDIGEYIGECLVEANDLIELGEDLAGGQQMARISGQILLLAKENDWLDSETVSEHEEQLARIEDAVKQP